MPSSREIKRRIKSVKNTQQITRAMEAVSATKMRRSQEVALKARPFSYAAMEILGNISGKFALDHLFLRRSEEKKVALVVITSDKGLCGSLNGNLLRKVISFVALLKNDGKDVFIVSVGKYGAGFLKRRKYDITRELNGIGDIASLNDSYPVLDFIIEYFRKKKCDAVYVAYTRFISTLKQTAEIIKILPLSSETFKAILEDVLPKSGKYSEEASDSINGGTNKRSKTRDKRFEFEYKLEPSQEVLADDLMDSLVRAEFYHLILEANASEHSARMVAMKNASENAKELLNTLQLFYNKARQSAITREISEVTGGAEALKKS